MNNIIVAIAIVLHSYHDNGNYFFIAYYYGDVRIVGGGSSGQLQFDTGSNNWGAICKKGFDDDAGNVACKQLGYARSSDVYTYSQ